MNQSEAIHEVLNLAGSEIAAVLGCSSEHARVYRKRLRDGKLSLEKQSEILNRFGYKQVAEAQFEKP